MDRLLSLHWQRAASANVTKKLPTHTIYADYKELDVITFMKNHVGANSRLGSS
jgi:hypothetical protein